MTIEILFAEVQRLNRQLEDLRLQSDMQLLSVDDIAKLVGVTATSVWRWVDDGEFPPPDMRISSRVTRWKASTVAKWQESCINNAV
jgi:predicted DNA-binding transcriptional regulator AlpA